MYLNSKEEKERLRILEAQNVARHRKELLDKKLALDNEMINFIRRVLNRNPGYQTLSFTNLMELNLKS